MRVWGRATHDLQLSLVISNSKSGEGQVISALIVMRNAGKTQLKYPMKFPLRDFALSVTDAKGAPVRLTKSACDEQRVGSGLVHEWGLVLAPGTGIKVKFRLDTAFDLAGAGNYLVTARYRGHERVDKNQWREFYVVSNVATMEIAGVGMGPAP